MAGDRHHPDHAAGIPLLHAARNAPRRLASPPPPRRQPLETMTLQVGEVVRLKSGGPAMTVVATGARAEPGVVDCAWFDGADDYAMASFPPRALERVSLAPPAQPPVALNSAGLAAP